MPQEQATEIAITTEVEVSVRSRSNRNCTLHPKMRLSSATEVAQPKLLATEVAETD